DLIIELAKRQSSTVDRIRNVRGMERRGLISQYPEIAAAISQALATPDAELPRRPRTGRQQLSPLLSQFLSTAIAHISRQHQMAPAIVGNSEDIRELLAYELEQADSPPAHGSSAEPENPEELPALLRGWRGEVVGRSFGDLLAGRLAIRVADYQAE